MKVDLHVRRAVEGTLVREGYPVTVVEDADRAMFGYADGSPGSRDDLPNSVPFIQKPFTPDGLRTIIRRATRHARGA